jgi:hypothetical protein
MTFDGTRLTVLNLTVSSNLTGTLTGNATTATTATNLLNQANSATITATSSNVGNQIVLRDGSGNFTAGTITATLSGNASTATNITQYTINQSVGTANSPTFAGLTVNSTIAASINGNAGTITGQANSATITATSSNVANQIVLRDGSGNFTAGTITAGSYGAVNATTGDFSGQIRVRAGQSSGSIANATGSLGGIEVLGGGGANAAFINFHRPGAFASYFGLDSDNVFKIGGWSNGAVAYTVLHSANYTSFAPGLTGSGASGTWGINITGSSTSCSGNSATATSSATATNLSTTQFNWNN